MCENGVIGDLYSHNGQKVFFVKEKIKGYNNDVVMTGTFEFISNGDLFNLGISYYCNPPAFNCIETPEYIKIQL